MKYSIFLILCLFNLEETDKQIITRRTSSIYTTISSELYLFIYIKSNNANNN